MLRLIGYQFKSTIVISIHWRVENESISPFRRASCYTCTYAHCECVGRRFAKCIGPCRPALELSCRRRRRDRPLGRTRNEFATIAWNDCPVIYGYAYIAPSVSHVCAYIPRVSSAKAFQPRDPYPEDAGDVQRESICSPWLSPFPASLCRSNRIHSRLLSRSTRTHCAEIGSFFDSCNREFVRK